MTDTATPPAGGAPSYGFDDPADDALAHEIVSYDPLDAPSPVRDDPRTAKRPMALPPASGLPPHLRDPILAQLGSLTGEGRTAREAELVLDALRDNSLKVRIAAGLGEGANPYQRAEFERADRLRMLGEEHDRLVAQMTEIEGYASVTNPDTGQAEPQPIYALKGSGRFAADQRIASIARERGHLEGDEGTRMLRAALQEAVALRKERDQIVADEAEVNRRADERRREDRINARVTARIGH